MLSTVTNSWILCSEKPIEWAFVDCFPDKKLHFFDACRGQAQADAAAAAPVRASSGATGTTGTISGTG